MKATEKRQAKLPLVEVEWVDACSKAGWRPRKEYIEQAIVPCRTAGYLVASNRKQVVVVQSLSDTSGHVTDGIVIPRVSVKKIRRLT